MHRFDLQDWQWGLIADLFPSNIGKTGEPWKDHRVVTNGLFHHLHSGCVWRDLPERYGPCQTVYDRFARCKADGTFDAMLRRLRTRLDKLGRIDWDFRCFDGTSVRAGRAAAGGRKKAGRRPWATAATASAASST